MGRKRKYHRHLPQGVTLRHGSYYLRKDGKWINLGRDLSNALQRFSAHQMQPERPTFRDLIRHFEQAAMVPERYTANTIKSYRCWLGPINRVFGDQPIDDFQQQDAHKYRAAHRQRTTANRQVALISTLMAYAVEIGWLPSSPMLGYRKPKAARESARKRTITPDEWARILNHADPVMRLLLKFAMHTALRESDIVGRRWSDVKTDGLYVTPIKTSKARGGDGVPMVFGTDGELGEILAELKALPVRSLIWLFPSKRHRQMSARTMQNYWTEIRDAAGVDCWFHDIRRTRITEIIERHGKDAGQRLAGHLDESSTRGYYAPEAIRIEGL